jgi:hypothetical protein
VTCWPADLRPGPTVIKLLSFLKETLNSYIPDSENGGVGNILDLGNIFSDLSMYRLRKFSALPFSDSDIKVENFLENAQKFYDIGACSMTFTPDEGVKIDGVAHG